MNKVIFGFFIAMLITVATIVSMYKVPFDETQFPGTQPAKSFGSCIAYMKYVHDNYSDFMAPDQLRQNDLAKDIVSLYYHDIKTNHPAAMMTITEGYNSGLEFITHFAEKASHQVVFTLAMEECVMTILESHEWAIENRPEQILQLMNKHNVTFQNYKDDDTVDYNIRDAI